MKWPRIDRARFQRLRRFMGWFVPGLGVKRWVLLALGGMIVLGMGLALFLHETYVMEYPNDTLLTLLSILALRFLPGWLRFLIIGGLGLGMGTYGIGELNRALMRP